MLACPALDAGTRGPEHPTSRAIQSPFHLTLTALKSLSDAPRSDAGPRAPDVPRAPESHSPQRHLARPTRQPRYMRPPRQNTHSLHSPSRHRPPHQATTRTQGRVEMSNAGFPSARPTTPSNRSEQTRTNPNARRTEDRRKNLKEPESPGFTISSKTLKIVTIQADFGPKKIFAQDLKSAFSSPRSLLAEQWRIHTRLTLGNRQWHLGSRLGRLGGTTEYSGRIPAMPTSCAGSGGPTNLG